jgi:hypothetical protein|tara:strand:+ start:2598 stop:2849 length:252 start_codon:yes stop_codon:yes gene_type:complete
MGLFKNVLGAALGLKTYQNVYNRPIVIPPPGYVIKGMQQMGLGSTWKISYSKSNNMNVTSYFKINSSTSGYTMGADKWDISWP